MEFLSQNSYFVVFIVVIVIWIGIFFYLTSIDRKITKLEKE